MFTGDSHASAKAKKVVDELVSHALTKPMPDTFRPAARRPGIVGDSGTRPTDATIQTLQETGAVKLIENHKGTAFVVSARPTQIGAACLVTWAVNAARVTST
jgi:hypothetical protein